jgi:hypothetical protein
MCERALQHKDAYVNILVDFMLDMTTLTPLFFGHKPTTAMIDTRTPQQLEHIKANKDKKTLKLDIYSTMPMLQLRYPTTISDWIPSVFLIGKTVLFATADELFIHKTSPTANSRKQLTKSLRKENSFLSC